MSTWRSLALIAVLLHTLGHLLFLLPLTGLTGSMGQSTRSWLLGDSALVRGAGILIFALALTLFAIAAQAVFKGQPWQATALWAAGISQLGLILFWATPLPAGVLPATLFNIAVAIASVGLK